MPSWWPETRLEWAFFALTAAQGVVNTTIQSYVLNTLHTSVRLAWPLLTNLCCRIIQVVYLKWVNSVIYEVTYHHSIDKFSVIHVLMVAQVPLSYIITLTLSINSLGCLYQMILTLDAYRIKNHLQIFAICIVNVCLSIATILQYGEIRDAQADAMAGYNGSNIPFVKQDWRFWQRVSPGLVVCTVVSSLCSAIMCVVAVKLYREFSWALYQNVSPDTGVQKKYMVYQVSAHDCALVDQVPCLSSYSFTLYSSSTRPTSSLPF